jgi:TetR/AcrR family transcriptional regulator
MTMFGHLRPKPDARMLRRLAARLGVPPQRCVLVEDTLEHQKAARRVGMKTVWMQRWIAPPARRRSRARTAAYVDRLHVDPRGAPPAALTAAARRRLTRRVCQCLPAAGAAGALCQNRRASHAPPPQQRATRCPTRLNIRPAPPPHPPDTAPAATVRKRPRPGERRVQILQTLAAMLEQPGAERITTAALAARLEVSEAALYRHFASKAQMFEGLIEFIESSVFALVNQIAERDESGALQAQRIALMLLQFGEKNPGMTRVMVGDALVFEHERLIARMNQFFDRVESQLRQCLRPAAEANGSPRPRSTPMPWRRPSPR